MGHFYKVLTCVTNNNIVYIFRMILYCGATLTHLRQIKLEFCVFYFAFCNSWKTTSCRGTPTICLTQMMEGKKALVCISLWKRKIWLLYFILKISRPLCVVFEPRATIQPRLGYLLLLNVTGIQAGIYILKKNQKPQHTHKRTYTHLLTLSQMSSITTRTVCLRGL